MPIRCTALNRILCSAWTRHSAVVDRYSNTWPGCLTAVSGLLDVLVRYSVVVTVFKYVRSQLILLPFFVSLRHSLSTSIASRGSPSTWRQAMANCVPHDNNPLIVKWRIVEDAVQLFHPTIRPWLPTSSSALVISSIMGRGGVVAGWVGCARRAGHNRKEHIDRNHRSCRSKYLPSFPILAAKPSEDD